MASRNVWDFSCIANEGEKSKKIDYLLVYKVKLLEIN